VYQFFNLVPTLDVEENVRLVLELNGVRGSEARERSMAMLQEVGLGDRASQSRRHAIRRRATAGGDCPRASCIGLRCCWLMSLPEISTNRPLGRFLPVLLSLARQRGADVVDCYA